jgi:hypothetical protein
VKSAQVDMSQIQTTKSNVWDQLVLECTKSLFLSTLTIAEDASYVSNHNLCQTQAEPLVSLDH